MRAYIFANLPPERKHGCACVHTHTYTRAHAYTHAHTGLEAQAIARINRIGQPKRPTVERLVIEDTIEPVVVAMAAAKKGLMATCAVQDGETLQTTDVERMFRLDERTA